MALAWGAVVAYQHERRLEPLRRHDVTAFRDTSGEPIPSSLLRLVGFFDNDKQSSFKQFPREAAPGKRRLCALGDSFTAGAEVDSAHDYPSRLQSRLDQTDPGKFEVLNFGQGWFGFHQTYIIWDELARHYDCDAVLLGPSTFYPARDTAFNHAGKTNPYYLHARYVIEGDDVRRVEVVGDTVEERFEEYHRLIPHWRYLRYDRVAPAAMLALLPDTWTADNPFYYRDDEREEEAHETYRHLLAGLSEDADAVILGAALRVASLAPAAPNFKTFRPLQPRAFPYLAARNHFGPIGNDLIARQYSAQVTGRQVASFPGFRIRDVAVADRPASTSAPASLDEFESIVFEMDGVRLGHFATGESHLERSGSPSKLADDGVAGLVLAGTPPPMRVTGSDGPLDGCFLPLSRPVRDGAPVTLSSGEQQTPIGRIRLWDPRLALGEIVLDEQYERRRLVLTSVNGLGSFVLPSRTSGDDPDPSAPVQLEVDGETFLIGTRTELHSAGGNCYTPRADCGGFVDPDATPSSGTLHLVAQGPPTVQIRVPVAKWEKVTLLRPR